MSHRNRFGYLVTNLCKSNDRFTPDVIPSTKKKAIIIPALPIMAGSTSLKHIKNYMITEYSNAQKIQKIRN